MGSVFGASCFLLLNTKGERFINEDAPGQEINNQIENLPDRMAWQFIDGNWKKHVPNVYPSHGSVCYIAEKEDLESNKIYNKLSTIDNYINPELINKAVKNGKLLKADSLEDLIDKTGLPKESAMQSIKRYNELCGNKADVDYGKNPLRLFDVSKPPFYAAKFTPAKMIAIMGGLQSDEETRCYDEQGKIILGLYVAGNIQGNRFAVEYPLTVPGLSHSMAITFGKIAGKNSLRGI
jgi:succinate dehydrogenase/fumarate reductase flavoprotein subunit